MFLGKPKTMNEGAMTTQATLEATTAPHGPCPLVLAADGPC